MDSDKIPNSELITRRTNLQKQIQENNLDAILIPLGVYFNYYFGKKAEPSERIIAGIIPPKGEPFIISPTFEQSNIEISTGITDIVCWGETDSPYQIIANELSERQIGQNIGVDPKLWIKEVEFIKKFSKVDLISAHQILEEQRMVKTDWEIQQLRKAAEYSSEGILASVPQLKAGITEIAFKEILTKELSSRSGNPLAFALIQFGENSAIPHGYPTSRKLKNDEVVLLDVGTSYMGYQGDITITVPFGKPKDFEMIYEIVFEANRKAFDADKEGMIPAQLDELARSHITEKGYGQYFTHRLGHGIGLEVHEHPYIVGTNTQPLKSGNCHTIEPGIYIPGKFGIRIEDDVLVKANNAELLYATPRHNF
ncbi:MAG: Xaa-Pro peptidase family protein [Candidatus Heimdallarchaeota archaeon]|nr:Xaa-Pro peptidase family protein [Candidatus Heimdallarchaeota archaeon]MDH5644487.1 Xaa-Pro peptidase family protein [Candidatus Heimdallarchaeota archaeon]